LAARQKYEIEPDAVVDRYVPQGSAEIMLTPTEFMSIKLGLFPPVLSYFPQESNSNFCENSWRISQALAKCGGRTLARRLDDHNALERSNHAVRAQRSTIQ
jgi:hypothetical protein